MGEKIDPMCKECARACKQGQGKVISCKRYTEKGGGKK